MHVRRDHIKKKQEAYTYQETNCCRYKRQLAHVLGAFQCRLQKAPERCSHHYACCKSGKDPLQFFRNILLKEENHRCAKRRSDKRDQDSNDYLNVHITTSTIIITNRLVLANLQNAQRKTAPQNEERFKCLLVTKTKIRSFSSLSCRLRILLRRQLPERESCNRPQCIHSSAHRLQEVIRHPGYMSDRPYQPLR